MATNRVLKIASITQDQRDAAGDPENIVTVTDDGNYVKIREFDKDLKITVEYSSESALRTRMYINVFLTKSEVDHNQANLRHTIGESIYSSLIRIPARVAADPRDVELEIPKSVFRFDDAVYVIHAAECRGPAAAARNVARDA